MNFISLFAGMCGGDLGLEQAGMTCVAQVEIDRACQRVLTEHWPSVPRWGDIRTVKGADLPDAELVVGGFPCTDLSVAGKRAGLSGESSGLWWEMARIIAEVLPPFVLIENVPGLVLTEDEYERFRCLCGWAPRRRRLRLRGRGPSRTFVFPKGRFQHGGEGARTFAGFTEGVRRQLSRRSVNQTEESRTDGAMVLLRATGSHIHRENHALSGSQTTASGVSTDGASDSSIAKSAGALEICSLDTGGPEGMRAYPATDSGTQPQRARPRDIFHRLACPRYETHCPSCGRGVDDLPEGPIIENGLATVCGTLAEFGYDVAWHVINAEHWVPQRRRRVFVLACYPPEAVGSAGVGRAAEILALTEGLRGHPAPRP